LGAEEKKERKGERMYIDDDLTNEGRKTQKKLREVAREERDKGKREKIGYRKIQVNGEGFIWDERERERKRGKTEETFLEEGEKKRRREDEPVRKGKGKRWTKKTDIGKEAQRGKSPPKEYKWESQGAKKRKEKGKATGGIITGVKLGIKEKRPEKGEEGCMERKVRIDNNGGKL
jgi:hypothetical protein